jgi:1-pyrroline-5-carboxylate dehydrogenase
MMIYNLPKPWNEPVYSYTPGSPERELLKKELDRQLNTVVEVPLIIGGKEIRKGAVKEIVSPHDHKKVLGTYFEATENEIELAVKAAIAAKEKWKKMAWYDRAAVFQKAASLISTKYRYILNAATMLGQSKNVHQAEIDATCETADFLRFNSYFMQEIYKEQPQSETHIWNRMEYRPLEGFVFAVSPFNFTAIGANLPTAPAMMGNTVVWKPASTSILSNYYFMQLLMEAGIPDGVINFLPSKGSVVSKIVFNDPDFGGVHFTGSTGVFNSMWKTISGNIENYRAYPRIVGETGGKDYIFVDKSADMKAAATGIIRAGFEYQGQKCSACSRVYAPSSKWAELKELLTEMVSRIKMGDVTDFRNFMNAVIDEAAFDSTMKYIDIAKNSKEAEILYGGNGDKTKGYFIEPTIILTENPHFITMEEEIFAPVVTVYVYDDNNLEAALDLVDNTSPYALTGAVFARGRDILVEISERLSETAGNFYINDKCSGAVVGRQPFGGSRASGTNDKAGSHLNLLRWTSPRTIKENFAPPKDFEYPWMQE